jgi:hypothetical protein
MQELPKEDSALDLEKTKPTQSAPEQEIKVEDQCRSAWVSQVLEKQRCHFVHFLTHTTGTALPQEEDGPMQDEATGDGDAPEQQEVVGDSDTPEQADDAREEEEESIMGNLSPISDDASTMDTEEYNRLTKELEDEEAAEVESAPPKKVLATLAVLDQQEAEDENTQSDPQPSNAGSPLSRERPHK